MNNYIRLVLKNGKEKSLLRFHRWVFSGAIGELPQNLTDGDWVEVYGHHGNYLATGYYQTGSIAVRIVSFVKTEINSEFWYSRIKNAAQLRDKLGLTQNPQTNCYRLVNGEGDQLPGLIVDWYNGSVVIQSHASGISRSVKQITESIKSIFNNSVKSIFYKPSWPLKDEETGHYLMGQPQNSSIMENGLTYCVNWETGQKTGYFLDQRENRLLLRKLAKGAKVLDAFCYAGGFSANALEGNASWVDAVDASPMAVELAGNNLDANKFAGRFKTINSDVLNYLKNYPDQYDIIVLDPPAYAKHISARHHAVQGYKRLNSMAINKINRGGLLFTFSCSQVVDTKLFENTIIASAIESGRMARVLYRLSQPADHPVNIFHPESEYLKGLVLEIE